MTINERRRVSEQDTATIDARTMRLGASAVDSKRSTAESQPRKDSELMRARRNALRGCCGIVEPDSESTRYSYDERASGRPYVYFHTLDVGPCNDNETESRYGDSISFARRLGLSFLALCGLVDLFAVYFGHSDDAAQTDTDESKASQ